jgi:hypothetical protein
MNKINKFDNVKVNQNNILNTLSKKGKINMKELVTKHFDQIKIRAEREVPEYGDFANVFEHFVNPDVSIGASDFIIRIVKPGKTIANHEKIRNLEIVAYNFPSPYKASMILATGTKNELLEKLKDEKLYEEIEEGLKTLSKDLTTI